MIVRSTTGGPIFVSPDKSRGDVSDVTDVTDVSDVSTVTVWSMYTPPQWFMIYQIYAVQCSYAGHLKIRCTNFFGYDNFKKELKKKNSFFLKKQS